MELKDKNTVTSDDEEDLEKLRLAALQSLKKTSSSLGSVNQTSNNFSNHYNGSKNNFNKLAYYKKNRGYGSRAIRNGQVNIRNRNSNLIAIPTVESVELEEPEKDDMAKLSLPQDRYCNAASTSKLKIEVKSKFTRYDNSDNSDSESEAENQQGNSEEENKLERTTSLEALMKELENEIQGDRKLIEEKPKVKAKTKKSKAKIVDSNNDAVKVSENPDQKIVLDQKKCNIKKESVINTKFDRTKRRAHLKTFDPLNENMISNFQNPVLPYRSQGVYQIDHFVQRNIPSYNTNVDYTSNSINPLPLPPPHSSSHILNNYNFPLQRPTSPLMVKTDMLNITMAPLSPRSAAFVLQNREIIERRKKSPRRSYSRSPSPRYRRSRSKSPRRSYSPHTLSHSLKSPRKLSPRRITPNRDHLNKQLSPNQYKKELSPNQKRSTNSKLPIKERLGNQPNKSCIESKSRKRSRSISPPLNLDRKNTKSTDPQTTTVEEFDPILAARKRKFETKEITPKEGIIRLKPQKENTPEENADKKAEMCDADDELLLEIDDFIDTKVDDLFSDEETDEENEGRFKSKSANNAPISVNHTNKHIKNERRRQFKHERRVHKNESRDRKRYPNFCSRRARSRSPLREDKIYKEKLKKSDCTKESVQNEKNSKHYTTFKNEKREKIPVTSPIENKKIEIKIRNPSKYEGSSKHAEDKLSDKIGKERKVEVTKDHLVHLRENEEDAESEIIIDNEEEYENINKGDGDLRAQLRRKRAKRQTKLPVPEHFQRRLLQNALEGAVYKQKCKNTNIKERSETQKETAATIKRTAILSNSYYVKIGFGQNYLHRFMDNKPTERKVQELHNPSSDIFFAPADLKLPIHLRLGRTNPSFEKSRKKRNLDQV